MSACGSAARLATQARQYLLRERTLTRCATNWKQALDQLMGDFH